MGFKIGVTERLMKKSVILLGVLLLATYYLAAAQNPPAREQASVAPSRKADEAAIHKLNDAFTKAFDAGDSKALAATFREDGELVSESGEIVSGREAITEHFAGSLSATPGAKIEIVTTSIRFFGPDAAIEEGRSILKLPSGGLPETNRYEAFHVRQNGTWLQARIREFPPEEPSPHERLTELEWLVGDWIDEGEDGVIETSCSWSADKNFLMRTLKMHVQGKHVMEITQRLGWDPVADQIHSWTFDSEGGHSEQFWSKSDKDRWVIKSVGVRSDGRRASSTHYLVRVGKDSAKWGSVDRTVGDAVEDDPRTYTLVRRPPQPK